MDYENWSFRLIGFIEKLIKENYPELADLFPFFGSRWEAKIDIVQGWHLIVLEDLGGSGIPMIGKFNDESDLENLINELSSGITPTKHTISFTKFCYFAESEAIDFDPKLISKAIIDWLNEIVIPQVLDLNKKRVQHAIPSPPNYNLSEISDNIFVLEDEFAFVQGTCFKLSPKKFVTCYHCTEDEKGKKCNNIQIFSPKNTGVKFSAIVEWSDPIADLAVIQTTVDTPGDGLPIGDSDALSMHDHIAAAGFPNYRYGDSGFLSPGLVVGFRPIQGINRIIVNIGLVSGISGGPGINKEGKVVGICATGAPANSKIHDTENHSLIPSNALVRYFDQAKA